MLCKESKKNLSSDCNFVLLQCFCQDDLDYYSWIEKTSFPNDLKAKCKTNWCCMKNDSINTEKGKRKEYPPTKQSNKPIFFLGFILSLGDDIQWLINVESGHVLFSYIKSFCKLSPCLCGWWQELGFSWWWLVPWGCSQCAEWCSDCPFSSGSIRSKCFLWSVSCARGCASLFQQLGYSPSLRLIWICKLSPEHEHSVQLEMPHSLLISLPVYTPLCKTWFIFRIL